MWWNPCSQLPAQRKVCKFYLAAKRSSFPPKGPAVCLCLKDSISGSTPPSSPSPILLGDQLLPLEEEEIQVVVLLGEEIPQDAGGVTATNLVGREAKVDALDKVPQLGHRILAELPGEGDQG